MNKPDDDDLNTSLGSVNVKIEISFPFMIMYHNIDDHVCIFNEDSYNLYAFKLTKT